MQKLKRLRLSLTCRVQSPLCWGSKALGRGWRRSRPVTVPCLWRAIAPLQGEIKAWGVDELGAHLCWSPRGVGPVRRLWIFQVLLEIKGLGVSPRSAVRKHPCWQGLLNHAAPLHAFCCTLTNYTWGPAIQAVPGLWGVGSMVLSWFSSCEAGWLWWAPMVCPMRSSSCSCQDWGWGAAPVQGAETTHGARQHPPGGLRTSPPAAVAVWWHLVLGWLLGPPGSMPWPCPSLFPEAGMIILLWSFGILLPVCMSLSHAQMHETGTKASALGVARFWGRISTVAL